MCSKKIGDRPAEGNGARLLPHATNPCQGRGTRRGTHPGWSQSLTLVYFTPGKGDPGVRTSWALAIPPPLLSPARNSPEASPPVRSNRKVGAPLVSVSASGWGGCRPIHAQKPAVSLSPFLPAPSDQKTENQVRRVRLQSQFPQKSTSSLSSFYQPKVDDHFGAKHLKWT